MECKEKTTTLQRGLWTTFGQGSTQKGVSWSVEGSCCSAQCVGWQPVFGLMQGYLYSHYLSSKMYTPRFLCTKATLSALGISWLSRGLLRGTPRKSGSASYPVTSIRLKIRCSALGLWSLHLINRSHCFTDIRACQAFVANVQCVSTVLYTVNIPLYTSENFMR